MLLSNLGKYFTLMTGVSILVMTATPIFAQSEPMPDPLQKNQVDQTEFTGKVTSYLLNGKGVVDGLLLDDGTQVKFPPNLSDRLVKVAQSGNEVSVMGTPGVPTDFGQEVKASSITNTETGEMIAEEPPVAPKAVDDEENNMTATGQVEQWLVGRRGEIKGMILSSGTQIKFPPHVGERLSTTAKDDSEIEVEGVGIENDYGTIIEAKMLQVDGEPIDLAKEQL